MVKKKKLKINKDFLEDDIDQFLLNNKTTK